MNVNQAFVYEKPRTSEGLSERLAVRFAPRQPRVIIVDENSEFRGVLCDHLQGSGLLVEAIASESKALALINEQEPPDLLVLELDATRINCFDFVDRLYAQGRETPIIFISTVKDVETVVTALTYYAEDYLVKPIHPAELAARIRRVLLRTGPIHQDGLEHAIDGRLRANFSKQYAIIDNRRSTLTPTENRILQTLYAHRGSVLSSDFLIANAWDVGHRGSLGSLWVHIRRLRNKIEPNPDDPIYVVTVRGQGYCLPIADKGMA